MPMRLAVACVLVLLIPAFASAQAAPTGARVGAAFPPPSIHFGDLFQLDIRSRHQIDVRSYSPEVPLTGGTTIFRRSRNGIEGHLFRALDYKVDAELRDLDRPWRDAYVNYHRLRAIQLQAGRFKIPFGREQLATVFGGRFIERSLAATYLAPARDRGVMVHGRLAGERLGYQAGVFRHDGDTARIGGRPGADRTWAARVLMAPWAQRHAIWQTLEFGAAAMGGELPHGSRGLRGRTLSLHTFFEPARVEGQRTRVAAEFGWTPGPFTFAGEYLRAEDERTTDAQQATQGIVAEGWYASASWMLSGWRRGPQPDPARALFGGGAGSFELAARIEQLRFRDADAADSNSDRVATFGVNWYPHRFARLLVNATHERIDDATRAPRPGRRGYWGLVSRLQLGF